MKAPKLTVAAIGFAILVIAMDFAVIRAAFLAGPGWGEPGARLLPHMLANPIFGPGPKGWAVFAFFLLPMIDALLIGVYRLRRRGDHTAGTLGYVIAGSVATLAVFTSCLISPGTAIGLSMPISRRIALASFQGLARLSGNSRRVAMTSCFPWNGLTWSSSRLSSRSRYSASCLCWRLSSGGGSAGTSDQAGRPWERASGKRRGTLRRPTWRSRGPAARRAADPGRSPAEPSECT